MKATELREALASTGTGERKLAVIDRLTEKNRDADAQEALNALNSELGADHLTVSKAREICGGKPPADFLGDPPPQSKEASEERLARAIVGALKGDNPIVGKAADKQAEANATGLGSTVAPKPAGATDARPEAPKGPGIYKTK